MSRPLSERSKLLSAARTRRFTSGVSPESQFWTRSEAEILILEIQFLIREFSGFGSAQNFHGLWVGEEIHRFHDRFIVLDWKQYRDRLFAFGDQNASGAAAELGKLALCLSDGHYRIRSLHNSAT